MNTRMTVYAYVSDLGRMREFYERALEVKPAFQAGNWLPFNLERGGTFALHGVRDADRDVQRFNMSLDVDDIDTAVARWRARGGMVLRGVADEAFGRRAIVEDPDGRQFEIVEHEVP